MGSLLILCVFILCGCAAMVLLCINSISAANRRYDLLEKEQKERHANNNN